MHIILDTWEEDELGTDLNPDQRPSAPSARHLDYDRSYSAGKHFPIIIFTPRLTSIIVSDFEKIDIRAQGESFTSLANKKISFHKDVILKRRKLKTLKSKHCPEYLLRGLTDGSP